MTHFRRPLLAVAALVALAACDRPAPTAAVVEAVTATRTLLGPDEGMKILEEYVDEAGNSVMVAEYAAGALRQTDGALIGSVASVVIRTSVPAYAGAGDSSSGYCITSSIVRVETTPGWTYAVKKAGGCDKEIIVELSNRTTGKKATFQFLYIPGKTRIDSGIVR